MNQATRAVQASKGAWPAEAAGYSPNGANGESPGCNPGVETPTGTAPQRGARKDRLTGTQPTNDASVRPVRAGSCGTGNPGLRFALPRAFTVRRVAAWMAELSVRESGVRPWPFWKAEVSRSSCAGIGCRFPLVQSPPQPCEYAVFRSPERFSGPVSGRRNSHQRSVTTRSGDRATARWQQPN